MTSRLPTILTLGFGLLLSACASAGAPTAAPSSSVSPTPTPGFTAAQTPRPPRPSPTVAPAPTYPANVMELPHFAPLEAETYFVEPVGTEMQVFYTIPSADWIGWFGAFKVGQDADPVAASVGLSILNVTNVVVDGCTYHAGLYPSVGPTVDDMAAALAALKPFELTEPPTAVTAFGFSGKYLELTVPDLAFEVTDDGTVFTDCRSGELWSWMGEPLGSAFYGYSQPGQVEEIWLLDVDGQRLMIDAGTSPNSSEAEIAELRSILDSIEIIP
jgi:hypothetical protein